MRCAVYRVVEIMDDAGIADVVYEWDVVALDFVDECGTIDFEDVFRMYLG